HRVEQLGHDPHRSFVARATRLGCGTGGLRHESRAGRAARAVLALFGPHLVIRISGPRPPGNGLGLVRRRALTPTLDADWSYSSCFVWFKDVSGSRPGFPGIPR